MFIFKFVSKARALTAFFSILVYGATAVVTPQSSQAIVGMAGMNPALVIAGAVLLTTGVTTAVVTPIACSASEPCQQANRGWGVLLSIVTSLPIGTAAVIIGVILLKDGVPALDFSRDLSLSLGHQLGMSDEETHAFNARRAEINIMSQEVALGLATTPQPTVQDSARLWRDATDTMGLNALEREALGKVMTALTPQQISR